MKNLGQIMKQVQDMQSRMTELQDKLVDWEIEGSSGSGMVQVTLNGKGAVKVLKIDPSLVNPAEVVVLEDLIVAALNDARTKLDDKRETEMTKFTGGLPLPPGFKLPF
jgi:nucleoid-associated protein EbfC